MAPRLRSGTWMTSSWIHAIDAGVRSMKTIRSRWWVLAAVAVLTSCAAAYTVHRGFDRGYPRGSVPGARPETGASTGVSTSTTGREAPQRQRVLRTTSFKLIKDPGGSFATKAVAGGAVFVELKEPADCRWTAPAKSRDYSVTIERGGAAKQRSKGFSGGPETALVTLRRLGKGDVDVELTCRRSSASSDEEPERKMTIRLVSP